MTYNPERPKEIESLETLRGYINSIDHKILENISFGKNKRGMEYHDLTYYIPFPIAETRQEQNTTRSEFTDWVSLYGDLILNQHNLEQDKDFKSIAPELEFNEDNSWEGIQCRMGVLAYRRAWFALRAGRTKQQQGLPVFDETREESIKHNAWQHGEQYQHGKLSHQVADRIITVCRQLQQFEQGVYMVDYPDYFPHGLDGTDGSQ